MIDYACSKCGRTGRGNVAGQILYCGVCTLGLAKYVDNHPEEFNIPQGKHHRTFYGKKEKFRPTSERWGLPPSSPA